MYETLVVIALGFIALQSYEITRQLVSIHRLIAYRFRVELKPHHPADAYLQKDPEERHAAEDFKSKYG